jgi:hypothetical protein
MAYREVISTPFPERVDAELTMTFKTGAGVAIPSADVTALTLTLYVNDAAQTIINSRNDTNILNTGPGTYHATSGLLTVALSAADMAIVGADGPAAEIHIALVEMTYGGGKTARQEVQFTVINMNRVP